MGDFRKIVTCAQGQKGAKKGTYCFFLILLNVLRPSHPYIGDFTPKNPNFSQTIIYLCKFTKILKCFASIAKFGFLPIYPPKKLLFLQTKAHPLLAVPLKQPWLRYIIAYSKFLLPNSHLILLHYLHVRPFDIEN